MASRQPDRRRLLVRVGIIERLIPRVAGGTRSRMGSFVYFHGSGVMQQGRSAGRRFVLDLARTPVPCLNSRHGELPSFAVRKMGSCPANRRIAAVDTGRARRSLIIRNSIRILAAPSRSIASSEVAVLGREHQTSRCWSAPCGIELEKQMAPHDSLALRVKLDAADLLQGSPASFRIGR